MKKRSKDKQKHTYKAQNRKLTLKSRSDITSFGRVSDVTLTRNVPIPIYMATYLLIPQNELPRILIKKYYFRQKSKIHVEIYLSISVQVKYASLIYRKEMST